MKSVYFLYIDGQYECDTLLFALPTQRAAEAAAEKINKFVERAKARLPKEPPYEDNLIAWDEWFDAHEKAVAKLRWPYGINMLHRDCVCIGSMPLKAKP